MPSSAQAHTQLQPQASSDNLPELFTLDTLGENAENTESAALVSVDMNNKQLKHADINDVGTSGTAAWHDSDDEEIEVSLESRNLTKKLKRKLDEDRVSGAEYEKRLRSHFERVYGAPSWAQNRVDAANTLFTSDGTRMLLWQKKSGGRFAHLRTDKIDIQKLFDANQKAYARAGVSSLDFHPSKGLLLVGSFDKSLKIFSIDGKINPLVTSLLLKSCPVHTCKFSADGDAVFASGRRKYMYKWLPEDNKVEKITRLYGHNESQPSFEQFRTSQSGKFIALLGADGWVNIVSAQTGRWLQHFQTCCGEPIADLAWGAPNASEDEIAYCLSASGTVVEYSVARQRTLRKWSDISLVRATKIAIAGDEDALCALGSNTGIVNIFKMHSEEPQLFKTIESLTTTISHVVFNPTGEILAIASHAKKDAFRLINTSSGTVFPNWPTDRTKIGRVTSVAFSPGGELLAVAEVRGRVGLWRLKHYSSSNV